MSKIPNVLQSASKIVFILMALGANGAMFCKLITGDQYMILVGICFTFYFSNKGDGSAENSRIPTTPNLGK